MSNFKIKFGGNKSKPLFEKKVKYAKVQYGEAKDIEKDAEMELNELQLAFREKAKAKAEKELQDKNTEGDFFSCIVFKDQNQRDQFLELLGINEVDGQYINGQKLITALELRIAHLNEKAPGKFRCNKDILELSMVPNF
ncbi:MAG TPA: hypothetical protein PL085_11625 [Agriterribacter sp.]|uniref:hypothetical protein n=1 Tax=Agriterribacter sp. TaxID=2821509 RepID=UPI002BD0E5FA|nr:hypothetical protein [Agriterribacter sp.]HRQ17719.1 hypothetical protein [Agriterribacter sp.]